MKYDPVKHECSDCGTLCTPEAFKYHPKKECLAIQFKNRILKDEIDNYGKFNDYGGGI